MQAYSYRRFSSQQQAKGSSLERQTKASREFAIKQGWTLSDVSFNDLGVSAFRGANVKRGELSDFLSAVQSGSISTPCALIVESLDRVSRDKLSQGMATFQALLAAGVTVATVSDNQVYTPADKDNLGALMIAMVNLHRAHEENLIKSQRSLGAWQKARDGRAKSIGGRCPWWLERCPDAGYKPIPERAELIQKLFQRYLDGMPNAELQRFMQTNSPDHEKSWSISSIRSILTSGIVIGLWTPREPNATPVPLYPPIVSERVFYAALELRKGKQDQSKRRGLASYTDNLFKGIVKCGTCSGVRVYHQPRVPYKYLRCVAKEHLRSCSGGVNVSYADSMLALKCLLANVDSRPPAEHDDEHSSTLRELEQTIAGHQTAIDNVKAAIATTVDPSTIGALTATLTGSIAAKSQAQAKLQAYQVEHKAKLSVNERISAYADIMHDIDSSVGSPEIANRVNARLRQLGLTVLVDRQEFRLMENGSPIGSLSSTQIAALKEADKEIKAVQVERLAIAR